MEKINDEDVYNFLIDSLHRDPEDEIVVSGEFLHIMHGMNSKLRLMETMAETSRIKRKRREEKQENKCEKALRRIVEDSSMSKDDILKLAMVALGKED